HPLDNSIARLRLWAQFGDATYRRPKRTFHESDLETVLVEDERFDLGYRGCAWRPVVLFGHSCPMLTDCPRNASRSMRVAIDTSSAVVHCDSDAAAAARAAPSFRRKLILVAGISPEGEPMIRFALLITAVAVSLGTAAVATAGGLTPSTLINAGWTCFTDPGAPRIVCSDPGHGRPVIPAPPDRPASYTFKRFSLGGTSTCTVSLSCD